ncbi:hypothetical protein KVV02_003928 [Mortierella alpina]|uniref:protein-tyrosine-phosphatase n=1 Tax=Mortierella alpina TaxID=64518 RepID=A0A9P8CVR6_MORAP|nr:hypothetical protein KVV02_003928 [Mortierella alpina]
MDTVPHRIPKTDQHLYPQQGATHSEQPASAVSERIEHHHPFSSAGSSNNHHTQSMDDQAHLAINSHSCNSTTQGMQGNSTLRDQLPHPKQEPVQQKQQPQQRQNHHPLHNSSHGNPTDINTTPSKPALSLPESSPSPVLPQPQSLSNGSHMKTSTPQDSLGASLARSGPARRASFNLSTGTLNLTAKAPPSLASPSSPSYSTLAVARARAAAAQGQGVKDEDISESGVFPGGLASIPFPPPTSSSSSTSPFDLPIGSSTAQRRPSHVDPSSLASSSSSLRSNGSSSSPTGSGSGFGSGSGSSSGASLTHLQDNAKAEREVSMILQDFLYLGGELIEEEQIMELENLGVKRVLNMAVNCDDELWIQRFGNEGYLKVGLRDHVDQDLTDGLDEAIKFIAASKAPIYVHCQAGKSRSVATVIGYLIQEHQWPLKRAYDHVVECRRCMSPNIGFVSQLVLLEERVLGPERAGGLTGGEQADSGAERMIPPPWATS